LSQITGEVHCAGTGLSGIAVSNGEEVVCTGADGRYALQVIPGEHRFLCVTTPDGYAPASSFFHRISESDAQIDFELVAVPRRLRTRFRVAHITDLHVVAERGQLTSEEILVEDLKAVEAEAEPDFIVATGDLTNRGTEAELNHLSHALAAIDTPVFSLFGGHDGNEERLAGDPDAGFTRNFESLIGPPWFSFGWGGRHFAFYPAEEAFFSFADRERKRQWLRADLGVQPSDREIVVVTHTPPPASFLEELADCGVDAVLYGHWHSSKIFACGSTVVAAAPPLCFGGIDTQPRGYRLVDFGGEGPLFTRVSLGGDTLMPESPERIELGEQTWECVWEHELPGGLHRAGAVRLEDQIFLSLADESWPGEVGVRCLDARAGTVQWQVATDAIVKNAPAVAAGTCVALTVTGRLYAIDAADGQVRWQVDLPKYPDRWLFTTPVIAGDSILAGGKAGYGAFALETGASLWHTPLESSDNWSCYANPLVYRDLLIALVQRRGLLALHRATGQIVWEQELGVEYQYGSPVLGGDLLISGGDGGHLAVLRAESGEPLWHRPVLGTGYPTGLAVGGEDIIAATADGRARCHDLHSGDLRWSFQTGADLLDMTPYRRGISSLLAAPVLRDGLVLCGGNDGVLHVLEKRTGHRLNRVILGAPITATPYWMDSELLIGTCVGPLCCYHLRKDGE